MTQPTLRYRAKGAAVYRLQSALLLVQGQDTTDALGRPFPRGKSFVADGQFGKITEQAVTAYQGIKGFSDPLMRADGVCDQRTWATLQADLGGAMPAALPPKIVSGGRRLGSKAAGLAPRIEPPTGTPMPPWMSIAWEEYARNIHEYRGVKANPRILEYYKVGWISKDTIATAVDEGRRNATRILNVAKAHDERVAKRRAKKGYAPLEEKDTWAHQFANARQRDLDEIPWCAAFVGWCLRQAGYPRPDWKNRLGAKSWRPTGYKTNPGTFRYGAVAVVEFSKSHHVGFAVERGPDWVKFLGGNQGDSYNKSGGAVNIRKYVKVKNYKSVTFLWPGDVWPDVYNAAA